MRKLLQLQLRRCQCQSLLVARNRSIVVRPLLVSSQLSFFFSSTSSRRGTNGRRRRSAVLPNDGLTLADFVRRGPPPAPALKPQQEAQTQTTPMFTTQTKNTNNNDALSSSSTPYSFYIKTYGCQMNVSDSDIVRSLLLDAGLTEETSDEDRANVILTNTCAIRETAETKIWNRLALLKKQQQNRIHKQSKGRNKKQQQRQVIGVLGCMAERLKEKLLENGMADLVVGPDAYRDLPTLVYALLLPHDNNDGMDTAVNVQLSLDETYADVTPVRRNNVNYVSAFVSVMRGCNNMCSYCVVPFTRGRERSRPLDSIVSEVQKLVDEDGVKEVVLLGQNVNSYHDKSEAAVLAVATTNNDPRRSRREYQTSNAGFTNLYRLRGGEGYYFADLVEKVSNVSPELRVRFTSPHPKDYPPELLQLMAERSNVCNQLHMPAQSGSSTVLRRMRRGYTREAYLELIDTVVSTIPDVAITSDFIAGFCGETRQEHEDTLSLMEYVQYDQAFMFAYSMRDKTHAHRQLQDDVAQEVKLRRLQEIIDVFRTNVHQRNEQREVGRLRLVLVEGESKKSKPEAITWHGRTDQNKRIVFPMSSDLTCQQHRDVDLMLRQLRAGEQAAVTRDSTNSTSPLKPGDYAVVQVTEARGHTLRGRVLWSTTLSFFAEMNLSLMDEQLLKDSFVLPDTVTAVA